MATDATTTPVATSIHPDTDLGTVRLTVSDLARSRSFYEQAIGLTGTELDDGSLGFGISGERPLVELRGDSSAPALNRRRTGLFHLAILMPSRLDLALAVARLAEARWPLDGASDHLVSEALYLSDPDGNGIEIYRDRPREQWRFTEGQLEMATLPLDINDVLRELEQAEGFQRLAPAATRIGHVHLQVSDVAEAERFYSGVLGFDVMVRGYPGALFVSAGGYHHHLGLNTWNSAGSPPPPAGAVGLRSYEITLPSAAELDAVLGRVRAAGIPIEDRGSDRFVRTRRATGSSCARADRPPALSRRRMAIHRHPLPVNRHSSPDPGVSGSVGTTRAHRVCVIGAIQRRMRAVQAAERVRRSELAPCRLIAHVLGVLPPRRAMRIRVRREHLIELVRNRLDRRGVDAAVAVDLSGYFAWLRSRLPGSRST